MADSFTHLHVHTEFSMLDGAARVTDVVAKAAADGQPAMGITDHGNMYGVLDFYQACRTPGHQADHRHRGVHGPRRPPRAAGPRGRIDDSGGDAEGGRQALLPPDAAGRERHRLQEPDPAVEPRPTWRATTTSPGSTGSCSRTTTRGSSPPPGASAATSCSRCCNDEFDDALAKAARLQDIFGRDNLFVELQDHGIAEQHRTNPQLLEIARRIQAPLLATNDSHYTHRERPRGPRRPAVRADRRR